MSDILRSPVQNQFGSYGSTSSQSFMPSLGTAFHDRIPYILDGRSQINSQENKFENSYSRPLLSNYTTSTPTTNLTSSIRLYSDATKSTVSSTPSVKIWNSPVSLPKAPFLPEKAQRHQGMKTLVLDMDETLIHASTIPIAMPDCIVKLADGAKFYVLKRPHLDEFLQRMSKMYEIVIYTCGDREYATTLINEIDSNRYISYILHRDHCLRTRSGLGKDLSLIGRNLQHVIFIDNLEENLRRQKENGIKILDFYSNKKDEELKLLIPFLESATQIDDVRPIRKHHADFISKGLHKIEPPKSRQRSESIQTPRMLGQRKESVFGEDANKVHNAFEDKLNQSATEFNTQNKSFYSTPLNKRETSETSFSTILSPPKTTQKNPLETRFEEKMQQLKTSRPAYNYGDHDNHLISTGDFSNTPTHQSTTKGALPEANSQSWESLVNKQTRGNLFNRSPAREALVVKETREIPFTTLPRERIVLNKETISYSRERESGSIIENAMKLSQSFEKPTKIPERSPLLEDLYERINALEQKLKAKNYKNNMQY